MAPKWSKEMRTFIVGELAKWTPYKEVWERVTSKSLTEDVGLGPLDPKVFNYGMFRARCKRIPKAVIAKAHEEYLTSFDGIRWANDKNRIQGLSDLIDRVNEQLDDGDFDKNTTGTMAQLVVALRGIHEQMRKEVQADLDRAALSASGVRVLLTNPRNVTIDVGYMNEMIMVCRTEIGGLHNLDFTALSVTELGQLKQVIERVLEAKISAATQIEIVEEVDDEDV
ncbi:MAG: hypothetical protein WC052_04825 [Patescibacteria group bacterium]